MLHRAVKNVFFLTTSLNFPQFGLYAQKRDNFPTDSLQIQKFPARYQISCNYCVNLITKLPFFHDFATETNIRYLSQPGLAAKYVKKKRNENKTKGNGFNKDLIKTKQNISKNREM